MPSIRGLNKHDHHDHHDHLHDHLHDAHRPVAFALLEGDYACQTQLPTGIPSTASPPGGWTVDLQGLLHCRRATTSRQARETVDCLASVAWILTRQQSE